MLSGIIGLFIGFIVLLITIAAFVFWIWALIDCIKDRAVLSLNSLDIDLALLRIGLGMLEPEVDRDLLPERTKDRCEVRILGARGHCQMEFEVGASALSIVVGIQVVHPGVDLFQRFQMFRRAANRGKGRSEAGPDHKPDGGSVGLVGSRREQDDADRGKRDGACAIRPRCDDPE